MRLKRALIATLLTVLGGVLSLPGLASASALQIAPQELAEAVATREAKVPEFQYIREEADRLGLRVWLFGGTAAGFIHYVKWDLLREKGDTRYQADRFDYDFTNIYRSTQDLDIVVDGDVNQKEEFQKLLAAKFPYFLSDKTAWEVRSLHNSFGKPGQPGYKEALLNSYDFLNQDTDSNSTGLIEITRNQDEPVVRDLREWNRGSDNHFLNDTAKGQNTFYRSANHFKTSRAKAGDNPEIFSVIRALTKAFQYELSFSDQDWREMQKIVDDFSKNDITEKNSYRFTDMGKKLFKHAVNLEYAWNTLERMGLRKKLMQFDNAEKLDSLAWLMNKEPLRTFAVGEGQGKTAQQMGLDIVAHETSDFLAYESITRAHTGDPNVFISREGVNGEKALHKNGFYTRVGNEGAVGNGMNIRFHLHPQARLGTDFKFVEIANYVVVLNKAALQVIPESLDMSLVEYLKMTVDIYTYNKNGTRPTANLALLEKAKRRMKSISRDPNNEEVLEAVTYLRKNMQKVDPYALDHLLRAWFSLPVSLQYLDIFNQALSSHLGEKYIAEFVLGNPVWSQWEGTVPMVRRYVQEKNEPVVWRLAQKTFAHPMWLQHPEIIKQALEIGLSPDVTGNLLIDLISNVLSKPGWENHPEFVDMILNNKNWSYYSSRYIAWLISRPGWSKYPRFFTQLLKVQNYDVTESLKHSVLFSPEWATAHPWVLEQFLLSGKAQISGKGLRSDYLQKEMLDLPHWKNNPKLKEMVKKTTFLGMGRMTSYNLKKAFEQGYTLRCESVLDIP